MAVDPLPQVGQIVKITSGRHTDQYAIIVAILDSRFVWIADGRKRSFDQPKKKNLLHLQLQNEISEVVVNSLKETGRVTNGKLRFSLNKYVANQPIDADEKGE